MAHLQTRTTRRKPAERYDAKLKLAKMLYQRGYKRQQVLDLFRFIDWIMTLPPELEQQFRYDVEQLETEVKMRYVTSIERLAMQEGWEKGQEEGREEGVQAGVRQSIVGVLQARFGVVPTTAAGRLEQVEDLERLQALLREAATAESLAAFEGALANGEE
jgi:hypothetical protein